VGPHTTWGAMELSRHEFLVERREISYLRYIIESYDGMALVRTIDPHEARIEIMIAPGCEAIVLELLESLRTDEDIMLNRIKK